MKNKIFKKRIAKVLITFFVLLFMLYFTTLCFMNNKWDDKYQTFINDKTEYDVLFYGSSHSLNAINPMQMWKDYCITSYNLSHPSSSIFMTYYALKETIKYHKPKIAIIDIYGINFRHKDNGDAFGYYHLMIDDFPLSRDKIDAIRDLYTDKEKQFELMFPFYSYHNSWTEHSPKTLFKNGIKRLFKKYTPHVKKGYALNSKVASNVNYANTKPVKINKDGIDFAKKIIAHCKENGVIPIFIFVPYLKQGNLSKYVEELHIIFKEEDIDFIDLREGIVDFRFDCADDSHLNPSGAKKVTEQLGKFLCEKYNFVDSKTKEQQNKWNLDYEKYKGYIFDEIQKQDDFLTLLMMLNHSEVFAKILAKNDVVLSETENAFIFENKNEIYFERDDKIDCDIKVEVYSKTNGSLLFEKEFITKRDLLAKTS